MKHETATDRKFRPANKVNANRREFLLALHIVSFVGEDAHRRLLGFRYGLPYAQLKGCQWMWLSHVRPNAVAQSEAG